MSDCWQQNCSGCIAKGIYPEECLSYVSEQCCSSCSVPTWECRHLWDVKYDDDSEEIE